MIARLVRAQPKRKGPKALSVGPKVLLGLRVLDRCDQYVPDMLVPNAQRPSYVAPAHVLARQVTNFGAGRRQFAQFFGQVDLLGLCHL